MDREAAFTPGPALVAMAGLGLFVVAATLHLTEITRVDQARGPLVAFTLDGLPALSLVVGGYRLSSREFSSTNERLVFLSAVAGGAIVTGVIGLGILVRAQEGRPVSEPAFQLLIGTTAGSIAGFAAGYFYAASLERATRANKAMSTLSFTNSVLRHDIKNDMTVVRGRARAIIDVEPDQEIVAESAETIDDQVEEVLDVIDTTNAIAETLSDDPDYEPIDVATVAREVVESHGATLRSTITLDAPETAEMYGNEAVRTIFANLVENGIEHNDADDPEVHVEIEREPSTIVARVTDNGPGIDPTRKRELFDPRPGETSGGGLHVVATLVENFDGEIRVEDNEPRGSTFVVELPRA